MREELTDKILGREPTSVRKEYFNPLRAVTVALKVGKLMLEESYAIPHPLEELESYMSVTQLGNAWFSEATHATDREIIVTGNELIKNPKAYAAKNYGKHLVHRAPYQEETL